MLRYFQRERTYLAEAAKEFARAHPTHAKHLQIESLSDPDPYVERLFEGFAFLAGRIHQRLDDDFPEFTERLIDLLYPQLLKPIPSMTMIEVTPDPSIEGPVLLPRLSQVRSRAVGKGSVRYRFTTTRDVLLHPISLETVEVTSTREAGPRCRLSFRLTSGTLTGLNLSPLRLQFSGQFGTALAVYLQFARNVKRVEVLAGADDPKIVATLSGHDAIRVGGFGPDEHMLPRSNREFIVDAEGEGSAVDRYLRPDGYSEFRLLQEYLVFPEKFLCVDILGVVFEEDLSDRFSLEFVFTSQFEEHEVPDEQNIKLHCTPAINLFQCSGEVIMLNHENTDYRVTPHRREKNASVYDIVEVTGLDQRSGRRHAFRPANSLEFRPGAPEEKAPRYVARTHQFDPQRPAVFLSFPDTGIDSPVETITTELLCTNGGDARKELAEGSIDELYPSQPNVQEIANLTRPTRYLSSPDTKDYLWYLLSHQVLSRTAIASREALVNMMRSYDWTEEEVIKDRIESILDVTSQPKEAPFRGAIVRGIELHVKIERSGFRHDGEVVLFGEVLSRILRNYATINSFVHLLIEVVPSGLTFRWQPPAGTRPVL